MHTNYIFCIFTAVVNMGHTSSSSLLCLPAEVRLRIYHHLFLGQNGYIHERYSPQLGHVLVASTVPAGFSEKEAALRRLLSILFTCRTCHQEAEPVLYRLLRLSFRAFCIDTSSVLTDIPTRHMLDRVKNISVRSSYIEFKQINLHSYLPKLRTVCIFLRKDLQDWNAPDPPTGLGGGVHSSKGTRCLHTWTPLVRAGKVDDKERKSASCDLLGENLKSRRRSDDFLVVLLSLRAESKPRPQYKVYVREEWRACWEDSRIEASTMAYHGT